MNDTRHNPTAAEELEASANRDDADPITDGIDRRGILNCMAWAGAGLVWTMAGGVPTARAFAAAVGQMAPPRGAAEFTFVQISDSHIGFNKEANPDVVGTLKPAIDQINALPRRPAFVSTPATSPTSSKPERFDTAAQMHQRREGRTASTSPASTTSLDDGDAISRPLRQGTQGSGWYSFDHKGVHFIGLVNVVQFKAGVWARSATSSSHG